MVKHEPTKFEKDRMENDITIVTNSQKWVGKAYLMFLDNLKKSGSEWKTRLAILVGLCEMLGAIL